MSDEARIELAELRTFLSGWLLGAKAALERGQLPPERFDKLIDMLKLQPTPDGEVAPTIDDKRAHAAMLQADVDLLKARTGATDDR